LNIGAAVSGKFKRSSYGVAFVAAIGMPPAKGQEVAIDTVKLSKAVIAETNAYRVSKGLTALQTDRALQMAAAAYATFLAKSEGVGHTADGQTPAKRVSAQGYMFCFVAENMWGGWRRPKPMTVDEAAKKAMEDWKKSPGHNANLLDKRGRQIGIGAAAWTQGDKVVFRIVQVFGDVCHAKPQVVHLQKGAPAKKSAN
jgi:uncharacterized protein YkwD